MVSVSGNIAKVSVDKKDECSKCGLCLFKEGLGKAEFSAFNDAHAEVGDNVVIEREKSFGLFSVVLAFFVPLLLIGVSVLINYLFVGWELFIPICSVSLIAVWYVILSFLDKKIKNKARFVSRVTEIIKNQN